MKLSETDIRNLGFEWPKHNLIAQQRVLVGEQIDLTATIAGLQSSSAFYQKQINAAYQFKSQHGADYSDFTDRFDEYAQKSRELAQVIAYLEQIVAAAT